jgi:hypothetical protein
MLAGREQVGRHLDGVAARLYRLDRRAGRDAAHHGDRDWPAAFLLGAGAHAAEVALDHRRGEAASAAIVPDRIRQLDHFDRARPIGQAADEAALLQRRDQAMDAGFGA